jgi:hypothetical protein
MPSIARDLARLPLIVRCVVAGAGCACMVGGVIVAINVISSYAAANILPAMLFGMFEAAVFGGIIGSIVGLIVGVLAYITRGALRGAAHRSN